MGFPTWTLYGMGISVLLALLMIVLAFIGQSPRFMRKVGLDIYRLDLRVRAFTGYAFAFLLITIGFFLAGVPLDGAIGVGAVLAEDTATPAGTMVGDAGDEDSAGNEAQLDEENNGNSILPSATFTRPAANNTPVTGAFGGPPPTAITTTTTITDTAGESGDEPEEPAGESATATPRSPITATAGTPTATPTSLPAATATGTPSSTPSPPPTATPLPTNTPTPTLTPTPIVGETALVESSGSNVWIYRSPGGQQLTLVGDGDLVILLSGHAHQGGMLWQQIMTVDGMTGWIEVSFLVFDGEQGA